MSQAGPSAIPTSDILAWLTIQGIDDRDSQMDYLFFIRSLDAEYLDYSHGKMKEQNDKMKSKVRQVTPRRR